MTTGAATATPLQTSTIEPVASRPAPQPSAGNGHGPVRVVGRARGEGPAGVRASRCGLRLRSDMSFDVWSALGTRIAGRAKSTSWWLGDWIVFGERQYGTRYRVAVQATGLDYQTLRNYAAVARRFDISRRRDELSLQHHAEVCALTDELQDRWLDLAVANGWSKNELRRRVREASNDDASVSVCRLRLDVDGPHQQRWLTPPQAAGVRLSNG